MSAECLVVVTPHAEFDRGDDGLVQQVLDHLVDLAHAATLSIAHSGLMNSPGHRANILRPEFGRVGIGIMDGGEYGLMITQNFRD